MTIAEWKATQTERDTLRLVRLALSKIRTGTTPPDIQSKPREQWEVQKRKALRHVMTEAGIAFADLQDGLTVRNKIALWVRGLSTVNDKTDVVSTYIPVFWNAYVEYRTVDISGDDDEQESYDAGSQPVYADSPAVVNGWTAFLSAPDVEKYSIMESAQ